MAQAGTIEERTLLKAIDAPERPNTRYIASAATRIDGSFSLTDSSINCAAMRCTAARSLATW